MYSLQVHATAPTRQAVQNITCPSGSTCTCTCTCTVYITVGVWTAPTCCQYRYITCCSGQYLYITCCSGQYLYSVLYLPSGCLDGSYLLPVPVHYLPQRVSGRLLRAAPPPSPRRPALHQAGTSWNLRDGTGHERTAGGMVLQTLYCVEC